MALQEVKEFLRPESSQAAVELLAKYGNRAVILAGGTFLHGLASRGLLPNLDALIDLQQAGLSYVKSEDGALALGAMATFADLRDADQLKGTSRFGAVSDAVRYPPPQIQNMATVGGSVATATSLFDLPVALMALDGTVKALGPAGFRAIGLDNFFLDYFEPALQKEELLVEVLLPKLPPRSASAFLKLETNANDLALLNIGVRITVDESGTCLEARVVVGGGVGKSPVRAVSCESILKGKRCSEKILAECAQAVLADVHPVSDHRASAQYRAAVAKVFVRRALLQALGRLGLTVS
ncbi:MAG TPA: FAD binding domain-containing protein [Candidatus Acidoferrales bacterium]|nr:FAD binding domain-containing protein [Candidatus Acidoferrales bacterium]